MWLEQSQSLCPHTYLYSVFGRTPRIRCGWIQRFKPLLDAYTSPYNDKYHFWTGFLLLVRVNLFVSFGLNFESNPSLNFTLIITTSTILIAIMQNGIYKSKLDCWRLHYANLILFSTFIITSTKAKRDAVMCVFGA